MVFDLNNCLVVEKIEEEANIYKLILRNFQILGIEGWSQKFR